MLKMEIQIDRNILEAEGYNYEKSMNILCDGLSRAGFIKEKALDGHIIYAGTGSNKDLAYMAIVYESLLKQQWFKNCCQKWYLWDNGEFAGDWIQSAKEGGLW